MTGLALIAPLWAFSGGNENEFLEKFSEMRQQSMVMVATSNDRVPAFKTAILPIANLIDSKGGSSTEKDVRRLATEVGGRTWSIDAPCALFPVRRDLWEISDRYQPSLTAPPRTSWVTKDGDSLFITKGTEAARLSAIAKKLKTIRLTWTDKLDNAEFRTRWVDRRDEEGLVLALAHSIGGKIVRGKGNVRRLVVDPPRFRRLRSATWDAWAKHVPEVHRGFSIRALSCAEFFRAASDGLIQKGIEQPAYIRWGRKFPVNHPVSVLVRRMTLQLIQEGEKVPEIKPGEPFGRITDVEGVFSNGKDVNFHVHFEDLKFYWGV